AAFAKLLSKSFDEKEAGVAALSASPHPKAGELLRGVLDGNLRYLKKQKKLVYFETRDRAYFAFDALTGEEIGKVSKRKLKRIKVNNKLRAQMRTLLASLALKSPDAADRLSAITAMMDRLDGSHVEIIRPLLETETDERVKSALRNALAIAQLGAASPDERLRAIQAVSANLEPSVRHKLKAIAESDPDRRVKDAADTTLKTIESRVRFYGYVETLFFGLSLGSVLALAAIGLAITFGVMGVINMAHGELIMLGAYTTYIVQQLMPEMIGLSVLVAIPAAFVVSGLVGILIERGIIRFMYDRPLETLLATFGVSLILQQAVRTLISPQNVPVANPEFLSGLWQINGALALTYNRLYIFIFCLLVFAALMVVLTRTPLGLQVRAVSQNRAMARAMGVRSARVDALTFGLGSGIAGIAGVALSQLTNVGPNLGQAYIVDSFMVVVFGGVGNLLGTLLAGLSLGIANKFMEPWAGAVLAKILVLVFIILFIQKRPRGLFPQRGRAVEN
ncbi:MAG: urea ABC transporter permease subunit UrtB, partial [Pseudomonadota bacterium]